MIAIWPSFCMETPFVIIMTFLSGCLQKDNKKNIDEQDSGKYSSIHYFKYLLINRKTKKPCI